MNWLLIIIVLLLALCVVNGYRKGFLRMMYSMVSWVIMFALVTWATPYINTFLRNNTSIYQTIATYCEQQIREKTEKQIEQETAAVTGEVADETQPAAGQQAGGVEQNNGQPADLTKLGVKLPDSVMNNISEKTADLAGEALDASGIYAKVSAGMADFILICCWDDRVAFFFRNTWYCIEDSDYPRNQQVSRNCCGSHIRLCGCLDCFLCDSALQYQ
jgi:hypothetical protein